MRVTRRARARGGLVMERPSGKFNKLAKPAFDRENPNAVLGEVAVPGLEQVTEPPPPAFFWHVETHIDLCLVHNRRRSLPAAPVACGDCSARSLIDTCSGPPCCVPVRWPVWSQNFNVATVVCISVVDRVRSMCVGVHGGTDPTVPEARSGAAAQGPPAGLVRRGEQQGARGRPSAWGGFNRCAAFVFTGSLCCFRRNSCCCFCLHSLKKTLFRPLLSST